MKNTTDADKEAEEFLRTAGIELTARHKELIQRCRDYTHRLIDHGASSWPQGFPLIGKTTTKPAAQITFDDIAARIYQNRRNTPKKGEPNVKKTA